MLSLTFVYPRRAKDLVRNNICHMFCILAQFCWEGLQILCSIFPAFCGSLYSTLASGNICFSSAITEHWVQQADRFSLKKKTFRQCHQRSD